MALDAQQAPVSGRRDADERDRRTGEQGGRVHVGGVVDPIPGDVGVRQDHAPRDEGDGRDRHGHRRHPRPQDQEQQQGPDQVELLLDRERPRVPDLGEVDAGDPRPVGDVRRGDGDRDQPRACR